MQKNRALIVLIVLNIAKISVKIVTSIMDKIFQQFGDLAILLVCLLSNLL